MHDGSKGKDHDNRDNGSVNSNKDNNTKKRFCETCSITNEIKNSDDHEDINIIHNSQSNNECDSDNGTTFGTAVHVRNVKKNTMNDINNNMNNNSAKNTNSNINNYINVDGELAHPTKIQNVLPLFKIKYCDASDGSCDSRTIENDKSDDNDEVSCWMDIYSNGYIDDDKDNDNTYKDNEIMNDANNKITSKSNSYNEKEVKKEMQDMWRSSLDFESLQSVNEEGKRGSKQSLLNSENNTNDLDKNTNNDIDSNDNLAKNNNDGGNKEIKDDRYVRYDEHEKDAYESEEGDLCLLRKPSVLEEESV